MFTKTLHPNTMGAIKLIKNISVIKRAYLAGGTALALQLGHRISVDLDFFTLEEINEKILLSDLVQLPEFVQDGTAWRTVWGKIGDTKFSMFYYKYPLLEQTKEFMGITIAGLKDIAAMKITAVMNRGTKRDFIDLYYLSKTYSIDQMLDFYDLKFSDLEEKKYHIVRSFNYFDDAEHDSEPQMLNDYSWIDIKEFFIKESQRLSKVFTGSENNIK